MLNAVRLNAYIPWPLASKTLLEIMTAVSGLASSVDEKPMPATLFPAKVLLSIRTFSTVPPPTDWSVYMPWPPPGPVALLFSMRLSWMTV